MYKCKLTSISFHRYRKWAVYQLSSYNAALGTTETSSGERSAEVQIYVGDFNKRIRRQIRTELLRYNHITSIPNVKGIRALTKCVSFPRTFSPLRSRYTIGVRKNVPVLLLICCRRLIQARRYLTSNEPRSSYGTPLILDPFAVVFSSTL